MIRELRKVVARLKAALWRGELIARDDSQAMARGTVRVATGTERGRVEMPQPYGFHSVPPLGSEGFGGAIDADSGHLVAYVVDKRADHPPGFAEGEAALYSDLGTYLELRRAGSERHLVGTVERVSLATAGGSIVADSSGITLSAGGSSIVIDSSGVTIKGPVHEVVVP